MGALKVVARSDYDKIKTYWIAYTNHIKSSLAGQADQHELYCLFTDGGGLVRASVSENGVPLYAHVPDEHYIILEYETKRLVTFCPDDKLSKWCEDNNVKEQNARASINFHRVKTNVGVPAYNAFYYSGLDDIISLNTFIRDCKHKDRFMLVQNYNKYNSRYLCRVFSREEDMTNKNLFTLKSSLYIVSDDQELTVWEESQFKTRWIQVPEDEL
jgi:hypothetical protein